MSAAGKPDDGGFSLVSEPAAKAAAPAAANDDGGFTLVSEPKPPSSWGDVVVKGVENIPAGLKSTLGRAEQAFGESFGKTDAEDVARYNAANPGANEKPLSILPQRGTEGAALAKSAEQDLQENAPQVDPGSFKDLTYQTIVGVPQLVAAVGATMVTKNPELGAELIAGAAGAQRYGQSRETGRTIDKSQMDAGFSALANGALASLPLGAMMRPGGTFLGKTLQTAGAAAFQNAATQALQEGYDSGVIGEHMTLGEAAQRVIDAGLVGGVTGALMGAGEHGVERLGARRAPPPDEITPAGQAAADLGANIEINGRQVAAAPTTEAVAGDIMAAGDIDQAIQTAQSAVTRPPLDVDAMGAEAKRQGEEAAKAPPAQVRSLKDRLLAGENIFDEPDFADAAAGTALDDGGYQEVALAQPAATDPHALQDVISARAPTPREPSLFDAIRGLGGIRDDHDDVDQIMQGFENPPFIRRVLNPNGRSPDSVRAALQEQGWFGPLPDRFGPQALETGSYPGDSLTDLYALMDREARGDKVYHPDSNIHPALAERAYLDQELTEAGVGAADSNKVAAQKLADFRAQRDADLLAYEQSRAVHEDADMASISHEDLLGLLGHGYEPIPPHEYEPGSDLGAEREEFGGPQASNPRPEDQHLGAREDAQNGGEPAGAGENGLAPQALTTEPGAAGLDQTVIPGTERSAVQLAAAREAVDRGRITADAVQKPADEGLFADRSAQPPDLFSDAASAPDAPGIPELPPALGARAIALKGIEGTGEEKSRSVSPGQTYHVGEEAPQIEAAARLVEKDPAAAEEIAMRRKQPPPGVHPEFVFMALENKATREGNTDLIARLNQSRISEEATTMGQRVAAYRNRDPLSAVAHVQAAQNAKVAAVEASTGDLAKARAQAEKEVTEQAQQAKKIAAATRPRQSYADFISSITCAGE